MTIHGTWYAAIFTSTLWLDSIFSTVEREETFSMESVSYFMGPHNIKDTVQQ